ncbi:MAG: hypothetical protein QNJ51_19000 [Calothrix sp. MO_167.B12]|nr:hypothetical protein [Calothrix sp. MO_167.B12]
MGFLKQVPLLFTPCLAVSMVTILPSKAATFASSEGNFLFTEFSQSPSTVFASFDGDVSAIAISESAKLFTEANPDAIFIVDPPVASNSSSSFALGETGDYLGTVESEATIRGVFDITAGTDFKFNFFGDLTLETSIDNGGESARASGDIFFTLIDTSNDTTVDFLSLVGNVNTPGGNDFIAYDKSENVALSNATNTDFNFGGNQEFAEADIIGSYQRYFANDTRLALVEVKRNRVVVSAVPVPEPSASPALFIASLTFFGCCSVMVKAKSNKPIECRK